MQQITLGHRGHADDPLYGIRRALRTGETFLTDRQRARLDAAFQIEEHVAVEATWAIYQRIVTADRNPDRPAGRQQLQAVIDSIGRGVPTALIELGKVGRRQGAAKVGWGMSRSSG